jgi:ComF family protein
MRCAERPRRDAAICASCLASLGGDSSRCRVCANHCASGLCAGCRRQRPAFDRTIVLADYRPPLDRIVHALKYRGELSIARGLGALLAGQIDPVAPIRTDPAPATSGWGPSEPAAIGGGSEEKPLLTAVPLAPARLSERGFNQALEIARAVGRARGVRVEATAIRRVRWEVPQARLAPDSRRTQTQGAFEADPLRVAGRAVWVVDDVITTGATLEACAAALKHAGARSVTNLVIARTPVDHVQRRSGPA